jgi:fibronectin-binding autotransporter adhesin
MYGGTHANTGDMVFRNDANQWMRWDESAGELEISTGIGAKTTALTISPALKATFAGAVTVAGTFNSLGIDDNATGERLQLADSSIQFGDGSAGESFLISLRSTTSGQLNLSGSTGSTTGAATLMYGSTHASRASDMRFRADNNTWMEWDESVGDLEISTGAAGAKTTALTIDSAQKATFAGAVTVQGAFTSLGIDDNATTEVMQLSGGAVSWGDASSGETYNQSIRTVTDGSLTVSGGNSNTDGGAISYYGSTHATLPGDIIIRSSNNTLLQWDESAGDLEIKTGVGAKTTALTIDASQNAAYAAALTAVGGVDKLTSATTVVDVAAATAPVSGQVLTATGDSAATWQTAAGGGAVGDAFLLMGG